MGHLYLNASTSPGGYPLHKGLARGEDSIQMEYDPASESIEVCSNGFPRVAGYDTEFTFTAGDRIAVIRKTCT